MPNVSQFAFDEEATAIDKARWLHARDLIYTQTPERIRAYIESLSEGDEKEDMRGKLNTIKNNLPKRGNKNEAKKTR